MTKETEPIRFELIDDDPEITLGDVILGNAQDLIRREITPEFKCRRCGIHYTFKPNDFCDWCSEGD